MFNSDKESEREGVGEVPIKYNHPGKGG